MEKEKFLFKMEKDKGIIIIADDDFTNRELVLEICRRIDSGYKLESYETGEEVEERFKQGFNGVELVIVDEVMDPGLRGSDLIKRYSSEAKIFGCKMILHTGEGHKTGEQAIRYGAFSYILKPTTPVKMDEIIRETLVD